MSRDPPSTLPPPRESGRSADRRWALASILVLYVFVHAYVIVHTVTPARDGARFLNFAVRLDGEPWRHVLKTSGDHPGYPVFLHAALWMAQKLGWESPSAQLALAQILTSICGLIFVILSYRILRGAWSPLVSWATMVAFVLLPRPAEHFSDILSGPLFSVLAVATALLVIKGIGAGKLRPFFLAGMITALAYTVRVDALILAALVTATLVFTACFRNLREPLGVVRRATAAVSFLAPVGITLALFVDFYGQLSPKPVSRVLLGFWSAEATGSHSALLHSGVVLPLTAGGFLSATWKYLEKVGREVQYLHMFTCLLGLALLPFTRRRFTTAGMLFLVAVLLYWLVAVRLLHRAGYLSGRYFLVLLPFALGFGMNAAERLGEWVDGVAGRGGTSEKWLWKRCTILLVLAGSLALSIPSLLGRSMHETSQGLLAAGKWIAANVREEDTVFDRYFYPTFLTGLRERTVRSLIPTKRRGSHYVIVQERDTKLVRKVTSAGARRVRSFLRRSEDKEPSVHVYRLAAKTKHGDPHGGKTNR